MSTSATNTEAAAARSPGSKRCAACKNQRRKCGQDCVLAPYFPATDPQRYACVQRVFGASNVARMLQVDKWIIMHRHFILRTYTVMHAMRRLFFPFFFNSLPLANQDTLASSVST